MKAVISLLSKVFDIVFDLIVFNKFSNWNSSSLESDPLFSIFLKEKQINSLCLNLLIKNDFICWIFGESFGLIVNSLFKKSELKKLN